MSLRSRTETAKPVADSPQFLVVGWGKTWFALPAETIRGILRPDEDATAGAGTTSGTAHAITDLGSRFGLSRSSFVLSPEARIILVGAGDVQEAFRVDQVVSLTEMPLDQVRPLPPHFTGPERTWFRGFFLFQDTVALLVNFGWLLNLSRDSLLPAASGEAGPLAALPAVSSGRASAVDAASCPGEAIEVVEVEESTDAEDTPWAEV